MNNPYIKQLYAVKREKKVLSVEDHISEPAEKDIQAGNANPLENVGYSRFLVTLIDKTGKDAKCPFCNIPVADIAYIHSMKDIALNYKVMHTLTGTEKENSGYTATLNYGVFRGQNAAQIVASNKEEAIRIRDSLTENLPKYPRNKEMIDQLNKALAEAEAGTLDASTASETGGKVITIYEQNYKPLKSRTDSAGRVLVYSVQIICNPKMRYPWEITIKNGWAPLKQTETGSYEVQTSDMVNQVSSSLKMTDAELCGMVDTMFFAFRDFSTNSFMDRHNLANEIYWTQVEEAKKNK